MTLLVFRRFAGALLLCLPMLGQADPADYLRAAVKDATLKCQALGDTEISIESCGNLIAKSPAATTARQAVRMAYEVRTQVLLSCRSGPTTCGEHVDWLFWAGASDALLDK
jgi:hypothetical protein